jgi:OmpR family response regulator RpaB
LNEKILVIDSDIFVRELLVQRLRLKGFRVSTAATGQAGIEEFHQIQPNLIIIDICLNTLDGYQVCLQIKKLSNIPIIIATALSKLSDKLMGLEFADDYILKPFIIQEFEARIRAVLRRYNYSVKASTFATAHLLETKHLIINTQTHQVFKNTKEVRLTSTELKLLTLLVANAGKILRRDFILNVIWGYTPERYFDTRVIDVHISRLRSKVENYPNSPSLIRTIRSVGYLVPKSEIIS